MFKAEKISEHVYWIGAIDWTLRDFHGYETGRGSTYNAYLIMADKITLVDTVKAEFRTELLDRISSIVDPKQINYIISNHSEMDHTGCLMDMIELIQPEAVYASAMGVKAIAEHFHSGHVVQAVKEGQALSLGNLTAEFIETRMLHWPDSMFTYLKEDGLLFSQDGFGMHLASHQRFADEIAADITHYESAKYFANILMPFSARIGKVLDKLEQSGNDLKFIAPDHGPVWRKDTAKIIAKYRNWVERRPAKKAVVTFATMWQSTELMARAVSDGLTDSGISVKYLPLKTSHRSDVAMEVLDAAALVVGSPTINDQMFPTVADVLTYLKGLKPRNLLGAAFGSYGWNGSATDDIKKYFEEMKITLAADPVKVNYVPDAAALEKCYALGKTVAEQIQAM